MVARIFFLLLLVSSVAAGIAGCGRADPVSLTLAGGSVGQELDLTLAGVRRFMEQNPDIVVHLQPVPSSSTERLELYHSFVRERSPQPDVLQVDVVWLGEMESHAADLGELITQPEIDEHLDDVLRNATIGDRLLALPWFADAPMLFYRRDLVEHYGFNGPPRTWDELEEMARIIQEGERVKGNLSFWGYVWQGMPYEGLTCNALEWQSSHGGGNFIDAQGRPNIDNPQAAEAFTRARKWVGGISPPEVLKFDEEAARNVWQRGDAAFMRNWAYAYALTRKNEMLADRFDVATLPYGRAGMAATLGGWQLMVSKYSRHPREAARLVSFLAGSEEQKRRAIEGSLNPTVDLLYDDPEILAAVPFFKGFDQTLHNLVLRPGLTAGPNYHLVSEIYYTAVHDILGGADPAERLPQAQRDLDRVLGKQEQAGSR